MACRNEEKCKEAIKKIREFTKEGEMIFLELDLASFESIRKFAKQIKDEYPVFDCLINNAGLAVQDKQLTKENFVSFKIRCLLSRKNNNLIIYRSYIVVLIIWDTFYSPTC